MTHEFLNPPTMFTPQGFSHVAIVTRKKHIYLAGQGGVNTVPEVIGKGDLAAQTDATYTNLRLALEAAGASFADVFKVVTYVVDLTAEKLEVIRAVRFKHVGDGPYPPSTMVGVSSLIHPDLLIEIEMIAAID